MTITPTFPIAISGLEFREPELRNPFELAVNVEFIDDSEAYEAEDHRGNRVRLIIEACDILLCSVVPPTFVASQCEVEHWDIGFGLIELCERWNGELMRTVVVDDKLNVETSTPSAWYLPPVEVDPNRKQSADHNFDPQDFQELWLKGRRRRRLPLRSLFRRPKQ